MSNPALFAAAATARDIDRRAVDQQCAAAGAGENAAVLEIDRAHLRAGRQHRDHDVTRGGSLGSRFGRPAAFCNKRLDGRRHEVETDHLMPGLQEIGRHRRPHIPQPNKADRRHPDFLLASNQIRATSPPSPEIRLENHGASFEMAASRLPQDDEVFLMPSTPSSS
jgi:hypothetical protein